LATRERALRLPRVQGRKRRAHQGFRIIFNHLERLPGPRPLQHRKFRIMQSGNIFLISKAMCNFKTAPNPRRQQFFEQGCLLYNILSLSLQINLQHIHK
jgi:hypothetical protein